MKIRRILFCMATIAISQISMAQKVLTAAQVPTLDVEKQLQYCHKQIKRALAELQQKDDSFDYTMEPRNILKGDKQKGWNCRKATPEEWCDGFWPGILWMDYQNTKDEAVRKAAEGYTESLKGIAYRPCYDHDIGFLMFCSYGKGYEVNHSQEYKNVILASADSLATLFNPIVGTILSWPREVKPRNWPHNTIMDNMMNLDMMLWAAKNGGNKLLYDLAVTHAKTTMQNHFRPDGSCYHVAVYDTISGDFVKGVTHQGYSDDSMWSRGQSWAIYGYTMVYRYTRNKMFLDFAQKVTDIYIKRLKETSDDLIPLWDMDDLRGVKGAPKDVSAACVVADALLELQQYVGGEKGEEYKQFAIQSLAQLSTDKYQSGKKNVAFLMHSTGHHPAGSEIDASIIYADYYYLEALNRAQDIVF
nr:glycoside hydrolase family 88 protein [Segatella copri]